MKVFIHNYPFQHDARNCCHLAIENLGYDNIRGFPNFSLSKFAIPYLMKQNEYFRRRVLWKSCISDLGLNVECTEETNLKKRNKNNNMKIINR